MPASAQTVTIENLVNPMPISSSTSLATYLAQAPTIRGAYIFSTTDAPGVVAANNFLTLANPVASGHTIIILGAFVSTYVAAGASATRNSMQGALANTISGGSVASASSIAKFSSAFPASIADIRTGNPTATIAANVFNSPPAIGVTASQFVHSVGGGASSASGPLTLAPGEGFVFHTAVGNVSQTWNISVVWGEI